MYLTNLTRDQFELRSNLIPDVKPGGRPCNIDVCVVLNAILYVLVEGIQWRTLPGDFPAWHRVYTYFRNWRQDETWLSIHDYLYQCGRMDQTRHPIPSEGAIDSQSVKSAAMVHQAVGYDVDKQIKGCKRFMTVDTLGLVLWVFMMAAWVSATGANGTETGKRMGNSVSRLHNIWTDGGFDDALFMIWVMEVCRWIVQVVLHSKETRGFVLLKKRWVVERTLGWLVGCRRLVRDYEYLPETSESSIWP